MNEMVEVVIDSIRVGLMSQNRVIILREMDTDRYLAIWIDAYMAEQITFALQEIEVARPMSHDLLKHVLQALNARLIRVEVTDLRNEVFYGNLIIATDSGHEIEIDSRPSDALALAVRSNVPILVAKKVMEEAGIVPEKDISDNAPNIPQQEQEETSQPMNEDRLSIFEDFFDNMDISEEEDDDGDDNDDDND
jgi:bifunctional DNase/RNase